jgi:hypothetical protein
MVVVTIMVIPSLPTPTTHRSIHHASLGSQILLFARNTAKDARGETAPYTFLGPATYVTHEGERPMSITWRLAHPMPPDMFDEAKVAAGKGLPEAVAQTSFSVLSARSPTFKIAG